MDNLDAVLEIRPTFRTCTACRKVKPPLDFYKGHGRCKSCYSVVQREAYLKRRAEPKPKRVRKPLTPEQIEDKKAKAYVRRMSITLEERDAMLAAQGGVCDICGSDEPNGPTWCTDHDHSCCPGKSRICGECIRGILCFRCNTVLGHARDNVETLRSAALYLERWESQRGSA